MTAGIEYSDDAWDQIDAIFKDPSRGALAARLDDRLEVFEARFGDAEFRRHGMQTDPRLYWFAVSGSGQTITVLWEPKPGGGYVHHVGPGLA